MPEKQSLKKRIIFRLTAAVILAMLIFASLPSCSAPQAPAPTPTPTPVERTFAPPTATPIPTPSATPSPSPTASSTPKPTPVISYPPFEVDASGNYIYPQVVVDKTAALTNEPVYFRIVTSDKVSSVQTIIDGSEEGVHKEYTTDKGMRIWQVRICFTKGGSRKVQFKCALSAGGTVYVPQNPIKINVTFNYTAESTSGTISSGKTVIFTLKTPDTIDMVDVVVDGVKQNLNCDKPDSSADGVSVWKLNVTFFKKGTRAVTFEAYDGTKLKQTFPDPGITIIVQ